MLKTIYLYLLISFSFLGCGMPTIGASDELIGSEGSGYVKISAEQAKQIIDGDGPYILVDVRTDAEYSEGHIEGAILIPNTEIAAKTTDELPDKDATILLYCRSGARSASAAKSLADIGYTKVYDIGGVVDWPYGLVAGKSVK